MKYIITKKQYSLISESFEFGGVKIKEIIIPTYSKDEYDLTMLYYKFMTNAYKFFIGNKQKFLDKFPLNGDMREFVNTEMDRMSKKWYQMKSEFDLSIKKYEGKMDELLSSLNNYVITTIKQTVTGTGIIRYEPSSNKTTLVGTEKMPTQGESGVIYFWNAYCTKDWLLIKPVLLKPPIYMGDLERNTFTYNEETDEITTNDGKKIPVYTNESDCETAMKIYEEQLKIYNENERELNKMYKYYVDNEKKGNEWSKKNGYEIRPIMTRNEYFGWNKFPKNFFKTAKIRKRGKNDKNYSDIDYFLVYPGDPSGPIYDWASALIKNFNNDFKPTHFVFGDSGNGIALVLYPKPIKPICDIPKMKTVIPPFEKTTDFTLFTPPTNVKPPQPKPEPIPIRKVQPTNFIVTWRDNNGRQNTHFFNTYEDWKQFTDKNTSWKDKSVNPSFTSAQAIYSGNLNLSIDKQY